MEAESLAHGSIRAAIHSIHTVSMARRHFFGRTQTLRDDSRSCQVLYAFSTYLFVHEVIDLSQELRLLSKYSLCLAEWKHIRAGIILFTTFYKTDLLAFSKYAVVRLQCTCYFYIVSEEEGEIFILRTNRKC